MPHAITDYKDQFGPVASFQLAHSYSCEPLAVVDNISRIACTTVMLKPATTTDNINLPVSVNVGFGQSFVLVAGTPRVDFCVGPGLGVPRISRYLGNE